MPERRRHRRAPQAYPVRVFIDDEEIRSGTLRDVSLGGMFIRCRDPLQPGETCQVEVVLYEPDDPVNIWLEGEVIRRERGGFALEITNLFLDSFEQLRSLLLRGGAEEEGITRPSSASPTLR